MSCPFSLPQLSSLVVPAKWSQARPNRASETTALQVAPELDCPQSESMIYDYVGSAAGSSTLEAALTEFGDISEGAWLDRLSRSESIQRHPGVVAIFRDADGRPRGLVYLERRDRGWLVVGWDRCV